MRQFKHLAAVAAVIKRLLRERKIIGYPKSGLLNYFSLNICRPIFCLLNLSDFARPPSPKGTEQYPTSLKIYFQFAGYLHTALASQQMSKFKEVILKKGP